jgi:hypothetical protein
MLLMRRPRSSTAASMGARYASSLSRAAACPLPVFLERFPPNRDQCHQQAHGPATSAAMTTVAPATNAAMTSSLMGPKSMVSVDHLSSRRLQQLCSDCGQEDT